jgi:hypothetical protein
MPECLAIPSFGRRSHGPMRTRLVFDDRERAAVQLLAVHTLNGGVHRTLVDERDEPKPARNPRLTVPD